MVKAKQIPHPRNKHPVLHLWFLRLGLSPFRFISIICICLTIVTLWFWLARAQGWSDLKHFTHQQFLGLSAKAGFVVTDVLIEGRQNTDIDLIRNLVNVRPGDPVFMLDPEAARLTLEKLSWIEAVSIARILPDTIKITIQERMPFALWQHKGELALIDKEGVVLTRQNLDAFNNHFLVIGENAHIHAYHLLDMLLKETEIAPRIIRARHVGGRRWDIWSDTDIQIKLPEKDIPLALAQLAQMQEQEKLLSKDIKVIDLRQPDRIMIRTRPGRLQEYQKGSKGI